MTRSEELFAQACTVMPGGVSSPVRAFGRVGGAPVFAASGRGSRITDVDGRQYLDLVNSWGPLIAGYSHPAIVAAVQAEVARATSFGAPCEVELQLAQKVVERMAGAIERIRFTCSGTEAVMTAARIARGATGRPLLVKFVGCYHGHADSFLVAAGSGVASLGLPDSPGVPSEIAADTLTVPYGRLDLVERVFAERGDEIAAVVTESVPANMGVIVPPEGFNKGLYEIAHRHGALMIQDEVLAGFRVSPTGGWGLQGRLEGWTPDLFTFGKVIGGGMPLAAVGGRAELMDRLAPVGPVYQAGTLSGNPAACAAGLATLELMDEDAYQKLYDIADRVSGIVSAALTREGVAHRLNKVTSLFSFFLTDEPVVDFASASRQDHEAFARFFHAALDEGVWLPPSGFEAWFCSTAITDDDLEHLERAMAVAARAAAGGS